RSKVSLSIKEQKFEYQTDDTQRAALASGLGSGPTGPGATSSGVSPTSALSSLGTDINQASDVASQNGLDSLLQIGVSGGLSFDASLSIGASFSGGLSISGGASISGGLSLGVGVDLGFSAGASLDASVSGGAAVDVFGGAAVQAAVGSSVD